MNNQDSHYERGAEGEQVSVSSGGPEIQLFDAAHKPAPEVNSRSASATGQGQAPDIKSPLMYGGYRALMVAGAGFGLYGFGTRAEQPRERVQISRPI